MQVLTSIHILTVALWYGLIAYEIRQEWKLWRAYTVETQRTLIERIRMTAIVVELPVVFLALVVGTIFLWKGGYLGHVKKWPDWFEDKLTCVSVLVSIHIFHVGFVLMRAKRADNLLGNEPPLSRLGVQKWHYAVALTGLAVPFALISLWYAITQPV